MAHLENMEGLRLKASIYFLETHHGYCNWAKLKELDEPHDCTINLLILRALLNMCLLQIEEDVPIFLDTYDEAIDDVVIIDNIIPEYINIGLILHKLPKS